MKNILIAFFSILTFSVSGQKICLQVDCRDTITVDTLSLNSRVSPAGNYTYLWKQASSSGKILNPESPNTQVVGLTSGMNVFTLTVSGLNGSATVYDTAIVIPIKASFCDTVIYSTVRDVKYFTVPDSSFMVTQRIIYDTAWQFSQHQDSVVTTRQVADTVKRDCPTPPPVNPPPVNPPPVEPPASNPISVFTTQKPSTASENDGDAVELGMKFRSSVAGTVTGIRFYKTPGNTGTHIGELYDAKGNRLASATFTSETASGWQTVTFSTVISIAANTTYIAAYFAPAGHYPAGANNGFRRVVTSGPLTALADGTDGGNGVYRYSSTPIFPSSSYQKSNYWVDIIFQPYD